MPEVAADLLEAGYDTSTIRRLAGEVNVRSSSDVESLVQRMFHEFAIRHPLSETQPNLIFSRQIAREVIAGVRNADKFEIAIWRWRLRIQCLVQFSESTKQ